MPAPRSSTFRTAGAMRCRPSIQRSCSNSATTRSLSSVSPIWRRVWSAVLISPAFQTCPRGGWTPASRRHSGRSERENPPVTALSCSSSRYGSDSSTYRCRRDLSGFMGAPWGRGGYIPLLSSPKLFDFIESLFTAFAVNGGVFSVVADL